MRSKFRLPSLLTVIVLSVAGVTATVAFAAGHFFEASTYEAKVKATATNEQGFEIAGATAVCNKTETVFTGLKLTEKSDHLKAKPKYVNCAVSLAGTHKATVASEECELNFEAAGNGETGAGKAALECPAGKEIKIKIEGLECEIKIPGGAGQNKALKGVTYENAPTNDITVKANVNKEIEWSSNCASLEVKSGKEGTYRGGEGLTTTPKLATGPAEALAVGETAEKSADPVKVN